MKGILFLFCSVLFLYGCGYTMGQGVLPAKYHTIAVPYVGGDKFGDLTAAIIKELSRSGHLRYQTGIADLSLQVDIVDFKEENIGYRYFRKKSGKLTDSIIPVESRATVLVDVTVVDCCSGCPVLGPARIFASVDFDHDYYFTRDQVNIFSLGQLSDVDAAREAMQRPLNQALARKIVDYVVNAW